MFFRASYQNLHWNETKKANGLNHSPKKVVWGEDSYVFTFD